MHDYHIFYYKAQYFRYIDMRCLQDEISYFLLQYELRLKVYLKLPCINSYLPPEREQDWNGLVLESY